MAHMVATSLHGVGTLLFTRLHCQHKGEAVGLDAELLVGSAKFLPKFWGAYTEVPQKAVFRTQETVKRALRATLGQRLCFHITPEPRTSCRFLKKRQDPHNSGFIRISHARHRAALCKAHIELH